MLRRFGLLLIVIAYGGAAHAQSTAADGAQKTVQIVRAATRPLVDGRLDEPVWATAAVVDDFHQVNPAEYAPASERTEVRLLYDDQALYVGVKVYTQPGDITANVLRQNGQITTGEDTFFVTIDPFNTRRGGYFFGVNANGVRADGLYRNVSEFYGDWDTIWRVETSRFDGGWVAEYEIPFKSISFDSSSDTWGLNFSRTLKVRNEDMAWVSRNRRWDPSTSGTMTGLEGLDQGVGLDIVPSGSVTKRHIYGAGGRVDSDVEPSLDIAYKLTPALNALLTLNTDFSATEVDDRQVNLTRFGLFFPEKRDFFLREADIFEFGRIGATDNNGAVSSAERQNARPFFSRRIGLGLTGEPVDLSYGGKVSGRIGSRFELGALSIRQDENLGVDAHTLSVVRAKAGLGAESTVGMVFTSGDPLSNLDNSLVGADYLYRNSKLRGGRTIEAGAWLQQSDSGDVPAPAGSPPRAVGVGRAAGIGVSIPSNAKFRGGIAVREVEANFNPGLGFLSRTGVRDVAGHIGYTHRPTGSYWQSLYFVLDAQRIEKLGGGLESQQIGVIPFQLTNGTGDAVWARSNFHREVLDVPFVVAPGVVIPPGEYTFDDLGLEVDFSAYRKISGRITFIDGDFYDGTSRRVFGNIAWSPSPRFRTTYGFNVNLLRLREGNFSTRIITAGFDVVFSSRLSWTNLLQYDNVSHVAGLNLRLNWIPQAGREVYFVINHNLLEIDQSNTFRSFSADAVAKVSYTFRF